METHLEEKYIWNILDSYFRAVSLVDCQISAFNDFVTYGIQEIVEQNSVISSQGYSIKFENVCLGQSFICETNRELHPLFPFDARRRILTYDCPIFCNIIETNSNSENKNETVKEHNKIMIGRLPIMLRSCICNLYSLSPEQRIEKGECRNDSGGYFIIKGKERAVVSQMRGIYNQICVFKQKGEKKIKYSAEVRSMSNETNHSVSIKAIIETDERTISFILPHIGKPILAGILFKAFGFPSEKDIRNLIRIKPDPKYEKLILYIYRDSLICETQEEALKFIANHAIHEIPSNEKTKYAWQVIQNESLPHFGISGTIKEQSLFFGMMINKLFRTLKKDRAEDSKDNYINKRIESTGMLFSEIFCNLFKKFINTISSRITTLKQKPDILSLIIKNNNIITKGLHQCMATGTWNVQKNGSYVKMGVSQVLDRMTYASSLSHLRRIIIPVGKKEGKNVAIRQIHGSSYGFICPCETPEGQKVGTVLNLSMTANITKKTQKIVVRNVLDKLPEIIQVDNFDVENDCKYDFAFIPVLLNGCIVGFTNDHVKLISKFLKLRRAQVINYEVSISYDPVDKEIRIFCDEGRLIRPLLRLENNKMIVERKDKYDWNDLVKNSLVEFLDPSEIEFKVLAMTQKDLAIQQNDYCEIHPFVMLGIMAGCIPFPDHSQSPRNCYQCLWEEENVYMGDGSLKKIKDIKPGDEVITVNSKTCEQSVTKVVSQYVKETEKQIVKVILISGRELVCTNDHPILVMEETGNVLWKQAGMLTQQDKVCVCPMLSKIEYAIEFYLRIDVSIKNKSIFVPVEKVISHKNIRIADITVESENHSFITGQGFCVHNSSMGKQALGIPLQSYNIRTDTNLYVLHYPQKPLVSTKLAKYLKLHEMPSGLNAIVAIAALSGYNQEDSCMLNKASVERGLFAITSYYTIEYCEKKRDTYSYEEICLPPASTVGIKDTDTKFFKRKNANYALLDENGIVKPRKFRNEKGEYYGECTFVKKGDVIIGKVICSGNKNSEYTKTDESIIIHQDQEGTIDRVHVSINPNGYKVIKIVIREWRQPTLGDKFAARSSQKATVGAIIPEIDMPRTADGMVPDIIINPCCIPGRMTINQLIECVLGKECLETGSFADATPFTESSVNVADKLVERLKKNGFNSKTGSYIDPYGWTTMYCGITGERFQSKIFMGPTYYQRLKHMVSDKMHARARGSLTNLTRQPLEGRSRDGGLKLGEMERDALVAHGVASVINERLFKVSDPFKIPVCKKCEIMVANETSCQSCKENDIKWVAIPYASKLLFTELNTLLLKLNIK